MDLMYDTWKEFIEEWGKPDSWNVVVKISAPGPDPEAEDSMWSLNIAQPRKNRTTEVFIKKATRKQVEMYLEQAIAVLREDFSTEGLRL